MKLNDIRVESSIMEYQIPGPGVSTPLPLGEADLGGANLDGANLDGADLRECP